jgi:phage tail protein X
MKTSTYHPLTFAMVQKVCLLSAVSCALAFSLTGKSMAAESTEDSHASPATTHYTVPQSTAVDKLVQKLYANSPLNMMVLRKALVDANPKVITGNPQQRLKAGVVIVVPDHAHVVKNVLAPIAASASETQEPGPAARDNYSRRQWVRFP